MDKKLKYFAYVRKSTTGDEKQALSIEQQIDKVNDCFGNLEIVEIIKEKNSAFKPYNRPEFTKMIERIRNGEAEGIIAWHPDRLSRNEVDASTITYMIRTGEIMDLKFGSYNFDNSPEGIWMLQMALSQSQYSSAKLSKDVQRGLEKKNKMGWQNGVAPLGYSNIVNLDTGIPEIGIDPERFNLIRQMWDLMLTGNYTPNKIKEIANEEWGFRTKIRKKSGGRPLSRSGIYKIFTSMFYAGYIQYKDQLIEGKHPPMVNLDEFDKVQSILGRDGKPRSKTHEFSFTGTIRCGECGCLITGTKKTKYVKAEDKMKDYVYCHCTKQKTGYKCEQPRIPLSELDRQINEQIKTLTILPEFRDWALDYLREKNDLEIENRTKIYGRQSKTLIQVQAELDNLTKMRYRELIDDGEYLRNKKDLSAKIKKLKKNVRDTEKRAEDWVELTDRAFDFATYARIHFANGDIQKQKEIIRTLGITFTLKDKILSIEPKEWLVPIQQGYQKLEQEYLSLEPYKKSSNKAKTEALSSVRAHWLGD